MQHKRNLFTIVEQNISEVYNNEDLTFKYFIYIWYIKNHKKNFVKVEIPKECFLYLKNNGIETITYRDFLENRICTQKNNYKNS